MLTKGVDPSEVIIATEDGVDLMPATIELARAEAELLTRTGREHVIKTMIETLEEDGAGYDWVLLDCPPSLGVMTVAALTAADGVLIPLQCETLSHRGVGQLLDTVHDVRRFTNRKLEVWGVLPTLYDGRTNHARTVLETISETYDLEVIEPPIPKTIKFAEAPAAGRSILRHQPQQQGRPRLPRGRREPGDAVRSARRRARRRRARRRERAAAGRTARHRCGRATAGSAPSVPRSPSPRSRCSARSVRCPSRRGTGPLPSRHGRAGRGVDRRRRRVPSGDCRTTPSVTPSATSTPDQSASADGVEASTDPSRDVTLPADSGSGKRVVFSEDRQRVWLVDEDEKVERTYLVSGSVYDNLDPGSYQVYSRSEQAQGIDDSGTMKYFVRFTQGDHAAIGFHDIPVDDGKPVQTVAQLGTPQSARLHPPAGGRRGRPLGVRADRHGRRRHRLSGVLLRHVPGL